MAEPTEEFEPLFDYHRVQPFSVVNLDDDSLDSPPIGCRKKQKVADTDFEKKDKNVDLIQIIDDEEKEADDVDWLPPPPIITNDAINFSEDSTIRELRLKRQELASLAQSATDIFREVEESVRRELAAAESTKRDLNASLESATGGNIERPARPSRERELK